MVSLFLLVCNTVLIIFIRYRATIRSQVVEAVNNHAAHPAVLAWTVGNVSVTICTLYAYLLIRFSFLFILQELNHGSDYNPTVWQFVRELKDLVHETEAQLGTWHPVGCPVADGVTLEPILTNHNDAVDVWMVNLYRGKTFTTFWDFYSKLSAKPVLVTEFGVSGYYKDKPLDYGTLGVSFLSPVSFVLSLSLKLSPLSPDLISHWYM